MLHRSKHSRRGIAATEMALMAPLILTLLMGLWEVGRYMSIQNLADNAAREAGRLGASGGFFSSSNFTAAPVPHTALVLAPPSTNTACELQKKVLLSLQSSGVPTTGATVTITNVTQGWAYTYTAAAVISGSGYDPTAAASQLDQLTVTVTVPYANVAWSPLSYFIGQSSTITATSNWNSIVDVPLAVSTTIPTKPLLSTDPLP